MSGSGSEEAPLLQEHMASFSILHTVLGGGILKGM